MSPPFLSQVLLVVLVVCSANISSNAFVVRPAAAPSSSSATPKSSSTGRMRIPTGTHELYQQKTSGEQQRRQPWNVFRFLQQSSKFVSLPSVLPSSKTSQIIQPGQVLWQPSSSSPSTNLKGLFQWAPLDDVVMGGVSYSTMDNGSGLWKGFVTDANNGGFVGIRTTTTNNLRLDLTSCRGLEWTFQLPSKKSTIQTPRRLKVVLRDSTDFNGIAWTTSVNIPPSSSSKQQQVTVKVPLTQKSLVPTRFAQIIKNSDNNKIDKTGVTALQLVYSKFEYEGALNPQFQVGDFELQLLQVKAY